jgi:glycosyltransferase involved in cell wall biosynthesis
MDNKSILLTIRCITYNHAPYIRQCLEGFIMQKTNFSFIVVIHDDASTDGTGDIINEYAKKYPIIKPILQKENQYSQGYNRIRLLLDEVIKSKYTAICEGDDYWTDPQKLQKQVDFLEANPDYSACFHQAIRHYEGNEYPDTLYADIDNRDYTGLELYDPKHRPPTASLVMRTDINKSNVYKRFIENNLSFSDIPMFLTCANEGKVRGMSDTMCVYRMHANGMSTIFHNGDKRILKFAADNLAIYKIFGNEYREECINIYVNDHINFFFHNFHHGRYPIYSLLKVFFSFPKVTLRFLTIRFKTYIHNNYD